jgi:hypothetical protein
VGDILAMEESYTQTNQSGANVLGLRLLFRLTRSQIQAIRVEGLPEGVRIAKKIFFQLGAEVTWDLALPDSTEVTTTVEYEGEPLVLTDFVWITERAQDNVLISIAKSVDPLKEAQFANNPLETVIRRSCSVVRSTPGRHRANSRSEDQEIPALLLELRS